MTLSGETEILEPEVIPPGEGEPRAAEVTGPEGINPILAGLIVDVLRFVVAGPIGFFVGSFTGFWIAQSNRLPLAYTLLTALAAGWYCWLPLPHRLPVATLVGIVYAIYRRKNR